MTAHIPTPPGQPADFYKSCVTKADGVGVKKVAMFNAYLRWCEETSKTPVSKRTFGWYLSRQFNLRHSEGRWWNVEINR